MDVKIGPAISDVTSIAVECADCGHSRWRRPTELYRIGIKPTACLESVAKRLFCSSCRSEGLPGKNVVVQAAFITSEGRRIAEAYVISKSQTARSAG
jgi:RNase P subunit RPR2